MSRAGMRLGIVGGVLAVVVVATIGLAARGPAGMPFTCVFQEVTGLHCAGCGMTRATHAVLEGRLLDAVRFNPLGVVLLPLALIALVPEVIGWVRGEAPRWRMPIGRRGGLVLLVLVVGYTVARNLPWAPFTLLAPP